MALSNEVVKEYTKRLLLSRMRILCNHGFYGLLLMHMIFSVDESCKTAATNGKRIYFGPQFLEELNDSELDFVMMHEILHVVLQHCTRQNDRDNVIFNLACDIVVNSNILWSMNMDMRAITLRKYGESMHKAPDGKEGYIYTAEQVYEMLLENPVPKGCKGRGTGSCDEGNAIDGGSLGGGNEAADSDVWDDHTRWGSEIEDEMLQEEWKKRFQDACEAISVRDPSNQKGLLPLFAERLLKELRKPKTDWRTILNDFVQEEIVDYSFLPPDKRFDGSPFFLPDFNEKEDVAEDILFMIDTSGSMSDGMITAAYSEVKGAIDQFDGRLRGWLGFFDAAVIEPKPFEDESEFRRISPKGGGGTAFSIIFEYVRNHMEEKPPASIIILTDGYAPFPQEQETGGIPVLWLINNEDVNPPWGKVARITE